MSAARKPKRLIKAQQSSASARKARQAAKGGK